MPAGHLKILFLKEIGFLGGLFLLPKNVLGGQLHVSRKSPSSCHSPSLNSLPVLFVPLHHNVHRPQSYQLSVKNS
ncbi:hypothetical protein THIOM_001102 [Candidatus Thiomargarita nelsonii]|uniref:Uncharacterized protein n=1 Tax=Candidatus Thiomargarita nelsonii TaxID=1003181 RepID=A0A176S4S7_9GAMM|nr:hypothetical protein THIOM_001102 [Candidatus Thiomargarita nelsonii]